MKILSKTRKFCIEKRSDISLVGRVVGIQPLSVITYSLKSGLVSESELNNNIIKQGTLFHDRRSVVGIRLTNTNPYGLILILMLII